MSAAADGVYGEKRTPRKTHSRWGGVNGKKEGDGSAGPGVQARVGPK